MRGSYFCAQPELAYSDAGNHSGDGSGSSGSGGNGSGSGSNREGEVASKSESKSNGVGDDGDDEGADGDHLSMFFRATYASAPFDRILEGIGRFGDAVREEFGLG